MIVAKVASSIGGTARLTNVARSTWSAPPKSKNANSPVHDDGPEVDLEHVFRADAWRRRQRSRVCLTLLAQLQGSRMVMTKQWISIPKPRAKKSGPRAPTPHWERVCADFIMACLQQQSTCERPHIFQQLESSFRRTDKEGVASLTSDDYPTLFCRLCWSATLA